MRSFIGRYGAALLAVSIATLLRYLAGPYLGARAIYIFYCIAITASALYGGSGAGLAAILLSAVIATFMFVPPAFRMSVSGPAD